MATIFSGQTPAVTNADNANAIYLGTYFIPAVDGLITKARWYPPTTSQSGAIAALFRTSDSAKIGADVTFAGSVAGPGWVEVDFASPVAVVGGTQYAVVVRTPRYYTATTGGSSPWPITNGDLSTPTNAGRFNDSDSADVQFPTDAFNNGCYFVDVEFTTGDDPAEGSAALGLDLALAATGARDSGGVAALGLALAVAGSGSISAEGVAAAGLGLTVAAAGARPASGSVALSLGLSVASTGARDSGGVAALGLGLAVSATGSNGQTGRPVKPWPGTVVPVSSYPWTPRPVRSFQEVDHP